MNLVWTDLEGNQILVPPRSTFITVNLLAAEAWLTASISTTMSSDSVFIGFPLKSWNCLSRASGVLALRYRILLSRMPLRFQFLKPVLFGDSTSPWGAVPLTNSLTRGEEVPPPHTTVHLSAEYTNPQRYFQYLIKFFH